MFILLLLGRGNANNTEIQDYNKQESKLETQLSLLVKQQRELQEQLSGINYQVNNLQSELRLLYSSQKEILGLIKEQKVTQKTVEKKIGNTDFVEQPKTHNSAPKKVEVKQEKDTIYR